MKVGYCVVCKKNKSRCHRFPNHQNPAKRKMWIDALGIAETDVGKSVVHYVCDEHFSSDCYTAKGVIRSDAVQCK